MKTPKSQLFALPIVLASAACTNDEDPLPPPPPPTTGATAGSDDGVDSTASDSGPGTADDTADGTADGGTCEDAIKQWGCQMKAYPLYCTSNGIPATGFECWTRDLSDEIQPVGCVGESSTVAVSPALHVGPVRACGMNSEAGPTEDECIAACEMESIADYPWPNTITQTGFGQLTGKVHCIPFGKNDKYASGTVGSCDYGTADVPFAVNSGVDCAENGCSGVAPPDCDDYDGSGAGLDGRLGATNYGHIDYDWVWDTAERSPEMLWGCDAGRYSFFDNAFHNLTADSLPFKLGLRNSDHSLKAWEHDSSYNRVGARYDLDSMDNALFAFSALWPSSEGEIHITLEVTTAASMVKTIHVDIEP